MARPRRRRWSRPATEGALILVALLLMLAAGTAGFLIGRETGDEDGAAAAETSGEETTTGEATTGATTTGETETESETATTETGGGETGDDGADPDGRAIFTSAGCGDCHTFEAAGSSGTVGPNLDDIDLSKDEIAEQVRNGGGAMPPYEGRLSDEEIDEVADFVENN